MRKIIISSDSTCDLSEDLIKEHNIEIMPLHISLDDKDYRDGVDITPEEIYKIYDERGILPKTSSPNLAEYQKHFARLSKENLEILHFSLGSGISSSYQNARLAASDFNNVHVIDSGNLSTGTGYLVLRAADLVSQGFDALQIVEKIEILKSHIDTSFVIDSLEYLREGGRCSTLAAIGANLLKIKPTIEVSNKDASMTVGKKYRGNLNQVLLKYVNDKLQDLPTINKERIIVSNSGMNQELFNSIIEEIESKNYFNEIITTKAGCTISSHCGANTLGVIFERNL